MIVKRCCNVVGVRSRGACVLDGRVIEKRVGSVLYNSDDSGNERSGKDEWNENP